MKDDLARNDTAFTKSLQSMDRKVGEQLPVNDQIELGEQIKVTVDQATRSLTELGERIHENGALS